jgi:two-component system NtrC family sensor kinase
MLISVTFQQRSVLLCCVLLAAVLAYMILHAEGIVDYALILGAGGLSLLVVPQLVARRIARSQPADEHQLFEGMFMDAAIGMALTDADGRWIRANPAVTKMLGYREDELVGRCFAEFTHPDDRGDGVRRVEALRDGQHSVAQYEKRYIARDGSEIWALVTLSQVTQWRSDQGLIVAQIQDITTRKRAEQALRESEERWQKLLASSQEMVMLVDHDGLLAYASPSLQRWLGYDPDELIGTVLGLSGHADDEPALVSHPEDEAALAQAFEDVCSLAADPSQSVSISHRVRNKDGSWHSLESTVVSLRDDPAVDAVLIASRDVTERVMLEHERERLELERRVSLRLEAVGQLAAGIAHEINTPLQFVGNSVTFLKKAVDELLTLTNLYRELLHTEEAIDKEERKRRAVAAEEDADLEYLSERIPDAFRRTVDGIARVTSIVRAMNRFSHPASSDTAPADLNEAINTTLIVCRNEYKYVADVEVELGDLPAVACDIGELNQVFLNLIINAAHAIEEKVAGTGTRGTIKIATRIEGNQAVVEIADDGAGIPPELQDRIYEPFFTTKELGKGSGQGLALARVTVEQHSGSLECTSAPGKGTSFTLRIPVKRGAADRAQAA